MHLGLHVSSKWAHSGTAITYTCHEHTTQTNAQFYATIKCVPLLRIFSKFNSAPSIWLQNTLQISYKEKPVTFEEIFFKGHKNHKCTARAQWMLKQMVHTVTTVFHRVWTSAFSYNTDNPSVHIPSVHPPELNTNRTAFPLQICSKGKDHLIQALRLCTGRTAHRGSRGIALPFHDHGNRWGEGSASRPGRSLPPGKTRYPLYRRLGGPQGRSGQVWEMSPHRDSIPGP